MFNFKNIFKKEKRHLFVTEYLLIVEDMRSGKKLTPQGDKYKNSTINNFSSALSRFTEYEKCCGPIYVEDIKKDLVWAEQFKVWLISKGYSKNTISMTLARLKSVLKTLFSKGIAEFPGTGIVCSNELTTAVYTTIDEIKILLDVDLTETPGLERVRDIYVMQCFIGLRYSDLAEILDNPELHKRVIGGKLFFEIKTKKTGEVVTIPIARIVNEILEKYNWCFGEPFSYQYYNLSIKNIAEKVGINKDIIFTRTEGGVRLDTTMKKYELISSHTARRTFATNAFLAGIPDRIIMAITGHKTILAFQKYIRCSNLEAAIRIADHEFFKIDFRQAELISYQDMTTPLLNTDNDRTTDKNN